MTSATEWLALAERLEQATGPDRELDEALARALSWRPDPEGRNSSPIFEYTASIDSILALISETLPEATDASWTWRVGNLPSGRHFAEFRITDIEGLGATPALALCAAFCRARASQEAEHG